MFSEILLDLPTSVNFMSILSLNIFAENFVEVFYFLDEHIDVDKLSSLARYYMRGMQYLDKIFFVY